MKYLARLQRADIYDVTQSYFFAAVGVIMWAGTLVAYLWLYMTLNDEDNKRATNFVLAVVINHGVVFLLTMLDAFGPAGKSIVLQFFVIGIGSFNTFALGGILGGSLAGSAIEEAFYPAIVSLALACLSNAQMLASLFALFHTGVERIEAMETPARLYSYPKMYKVGGLAF